MGLKIVAINGSHRGDRGYTRFLIDRLFAGAEAAGARCEVVSLARKKINRCLACGKCHGQEQHLRCVYDEKDQVRAIFAQMAGADLLVYATPVYVFSMSGLLKTFLDRMYSTGDVSDIKMSKSGLLFHHIDHDICSKPFVLLVCCDNLEHETPQNVIRYFKTFSRFMDAPQLGTLVRNAGRLTGHGKDSEREEQFPLIRKVYEAYEQAGRELVEKGRISRGTQRRATREVVPVPLFGLLKRFSWFKRTAVAKARQMMG